MPGDQAHDRLKRDIAGRARGERAGKLPAQLGCADTVDGRRETGSFRPARGPLDVFEPRQEAIDDRDRSDRRVAHVAINDRVGQCVSRLGLDCADALDDGQAGAIRRRFHTGHGIRPPHLDRLRPAPSIVMPGQDGPLGLDLMPSSRSLVFTWPNFCRLRDSSAVCFRRLPSTARVFVRKAARRSAAVRSPRWAP